MTPSPLPLIVVVKCRAPRRSLDVAFTRLTKPTFPSFGNRTARPKPNRGCCNVVDRPMVGRAAPHPVRVLPVPVVRHRLANGHGSVQPDVRAQDLDQRVHGAAGRAHRGAGVRGMRPVAGQRVPVAGHDRQRSVHVRPAVHNGRPVAELRQ